jgi:CDP-diacylglycerol--serine O-phosphatidyltransferase
MATVNKNKVIHSGTYLIPNLLTAFNLTFGVLAILLTLENFTGEQIAIPGNRAALPAWLILAAMIFDYLDGKVARWIHATSDFGVKIDSLTDFVTFGVAPMVVAYTTLLRYAPLWAQCISCLLFLLAGAWRLARFNCESGTEMSSYSFFTGLPIPAAAAFICTLVLASPNTEDLKMRFLGTPFAGLTPTMASLLVAALLVALAALMVSRIPFPAFKKINKRNLIILCGVGLFFAVLSLILPLENVVFLIMLLYLIIGLTQYFLDRVLRLQPRQGKH